MYKGEQCPLQSVPEHRSCKTQTFIGDPRSSLLFQIIFYEGRNFQGRHWECSSDCMDTFRHFNCCNSIRVSGGHWVTYEKPHYMGYQYVMGPGEYPDYHSWMGFNNCIRSCQMFNPVSQSNRQIGPGSARSPPPLATARRSPCTSNGALEMDVSQQRLMSFTDTHAGQSLKVSGARPTRKPSQPLKGL